MATQTFGRRGLPQAAPVAERKRSIGRPAVALGAVAAAGLVFAGVSTLRAPSSVPPAAAQCQGQTGAGCPSSGSRGAVFVHIPSSGGAAAASAPATSGGATQRGGFGATASALGAGGG